MTKRIIDLSGEEEINQDEPLHPSVLEAVQEEASARISFLAALEAEIALLDQWTDLTEQNLDRLSLV